MNYRLNRTAIILVALLLVAAIGVFAYTLITAPQGEAPATEEPATSTAPEVAARTISAQHQYKDGVHTIAGTVDLPSPCHKLATEPFFVGGGRDAVEVRFTTSIEGDVCAQVVTPARFKTSFEAPERVNISALFDGTPATLNLVQVAEGENLDDFDVFFKG